MPFYAHLSSLILSQLGAEKFSAELDGMFAGVVYDESKGEFTITRDELGKASLYWGRGHDGSVWVASEMKAIQQNCKEFSYFPPGGYIKINMKPRKDVAQHFELSLAQGQWYNAPWIDEDHIPTAPADLKKIHDTFVTAVVKRLMTDVPFGVLLSGETSIADHREHVF